MGGKRKGSDAGIEIQVDKHAYDADGGENVVNERKETFERADAAELSQRKIIRVKRSSHSNSANRFQSTSNNNPFAKIKLSQKKESLFNFTSGPKTEVKSSSSLFSFGEKGSKNTFSLGKETSVSRKGEIKEKIKRRVALNQNFLKVISNLDRNESSEWEKAVLNYIYYSQKINNSKEEKVIKEKTNAEKEEETEEGKVGIKVNDDETLLLKERGKVSVLDSGKWVTKGVGTLLLVSAKGSEGGFVRLQNEQNRKDKFKYFRAKESGSTTVGREEESSILWV